MAHIGLGILLKMNKELLMKLHGLCPLKSKSRDHKTICILFEHIYVTDKLNLFEVTIHSDNMEIAIDRGFLIAE